LRLLCDLLDSAASTDGDQIPPFKPMKIYVGFCRKPTFDLGVANDGLVPHFSPILVDADYMGERTVPRARTMGVKVWHYGIATTKQHAMRALNRRGSHNPTRSIFFKLSPVTKL